MPPIMVGMALRLVTEQETSKLEGLLAKLETLVESAMRGDEIDPQQVDATAKLTHAVARLYRERREAERTIKRDDLNKLVVTMAQAVNSHVPDPLIRREIERDWRRLAEESG